MKVKIYIEGGGDIDGQRERFRAAWVKFFKKSGLTNMPQTVVCGSRTRAFDRFTTAVRHDADMLHLLLVDSEDGVKSGKSAWQHLKNRKDDNFDKPSKAGVKDAFLMICCMETWFLADRDALAAFFGQGFNGKAIPAWAKLEEVPKRDVIDALDRSTKACGPRQYAKGDLSFELLATINPTEVEQKCDEAKRLLNRLRALLS